VLYLHPDKCQIDYSYSFNECRFNVLYHCLLSGSLYSESVESVSVYHDIVNSSDHEPICLLLSLQFHWVGFQKRIYTRHVSWVKASDDNLLEYKDVLS